MPQGNYSPDNPFAPQYSDDNPFAKKKTTAGEAFYDATSRTLINNVLATPRAAGDMLAAGAAGIEGGVSKLFGGEFNFGERFAEQQGKFPASALRAVPAPKIEDIGAATRALPALMPGGESFGDAFQANRAETSAEMGTMHAEHPFAIAAGGLAGDAATLATGRLPLAKGINKLESKLTAKAPELFFGSTKAMDPGVGRLATRVITSPAMKSVARGAGRSVEAGFEAATLDLLKGDDPLETAAYAAGGQMAGSFLLHAGKGLLSGGPLKAGAKLGLAAFSAGSIVQMLKSATPGGKDFILQSLETGYDKVTYGLVLGAVAGLAGGGRLRGGKLAEDLPKLTDAIATIPRGAMISLIEGFVDAPEPQQQQMETILVKLAEDPEYFGEGSTNRLSLAIENGTFAKELEVMQQEDDFQKKLFAIKPPELK